MISTFLRWGVRILRHLFSVFQVCGAPGVFFNSKCRFIVVGLYAVSNKVLTRAAATMFTKQLLL